MLLQRFGLTLNTVLVAAGVTIALGTALALARCVLSRILGPIFEYETLSLARKGHTFWLRTAFAVMTLALLYSAQPSSNVSPPDDSFLFDPGKSSSIQRQLRQAELQRFGSEFTNSYLLALAVAAILITPLTVATAISEENEKRTIEFLLATQLTSADIVIGKLAARVLNLFGILVAGAPVLAMTQLWGGVDWRIIAYGFAMIFFILTSYACAAVLCSVLFARTRNAMLAAYVLIVGINLLAIAADDPPTRASSPVGLLRTATEWSAQLQQLSGTSLAAALLARHLPFAAVHITLLTVGLALSTTRLRYFAARRAGKTRGVMDRPTVGPDQSIVVPHPLTIAPNPPLVGDPLSWKERYLGRTVGGWFLSSTFWIYLYLVLGVLLFTALVTFLLGLAEQMKPFDLILRAICVALGMLVLTSISLKMAGCVSREREQQTLVSLLSLPIHPTEILYAKWIGTWRRAGRAMVGLTMAFSAAALVAEFRAVAWVLLPLLFAAHVWFFGNLGLVLSVMCRSTNRAYLLLGACFLVIVAGTWVLSYLDGRKTDDYKPDERPDDYVVIRGDETIVLLGDHRHTRFEDCVSPPQSWWRLMAPPPRANLQQDEFATRGFVLAAFGYFVLGFVFWLYSVARFRGEGLRA